MDINGKLPKLPVLYNGNNPVGFTMTENEAEAICDLNHSLQWEYKRVVGEVEYSIAYNDFICNFMIKKEVAALVQMTINF